MKFSEQTIKSLSDCAENKTRLVVSGKNAIGQVFTTEGYILPGFTSEGKPNFIIENGFAFYVGQTKKYVSSNEHLFVPLYCQSGKDGYDADKMYIEKVVTKNGEEVYTNQDFENLINTSLEVQKNCEYTSHMITEPLSNHAKRLLKFIGKPIIYRYCSEKLVIKNIHMLNGFVCADATSGYIFHGLSRLEPGEIITDRQAYENLDKYEITTPQLEKPDGLCK